MLYMIYYVLVKKDELVRIKTMFTKRELNEYNYEKT